MEEERRALDRGGGGGGGGAGTRVTAFFLGLSFSAFSAGTEVDASLSFSVSATVTHLRFRDALRVVCLTIAMIRENRPRSGTAF